MLFNNFEVILAGKSYQLLYGLRALLEDKAYRKSPGINFGEEIKTLVYLMPLFSPH